MACVTKRRGAWVVDARIHGRRIVRVYRTRREARDAAAKLQAEIRRSARPGVDPFITLAQYVPRFLDDCREAEVAPATLHRYAKSFENHILPTLGRIRIREITRADVRTLLHSKRQEGVNVQGQKGQDRVPRGALRVIL